MTEEGKPSKSGLESTYKARALTRSADYTFLLTSGGHNGGIVCGPVNPKRRYREKTWNDAETYSDPGQWMQQAALHEGSWWPAWQAWLAARSGPSGAAVPCLGNESAGYRILGDAPGDYVLAR